MAARRRTFNKMMQSKLVCFLILLLAAYFVVAIRLAYISVKSGKKYEKQVLSQQRYDSTTLPFQRGEIRDRKGNVLAASVKVYNFILEPRNVIEADKYKEEARKGETQAATVDAIVKCFGEREVTKEELDAVITENPTSYYAKIPKLRKLSYDQKKKFEQYLQTEIPAAGGSENQKKEKIGDYVKGYVFEEEYQRTYPNGDSACHVLGFTSSGNVGNWGIEQAYHSYLGIRVSERRIGTGAHRQACRERRYDRIDHRPEHSEYSGKEDQAVYEKGRREKRIRPDHGSQQRRDPGDGKFQPL